jgi:hypothetical protein
MVSKEKMPVCALKKDGGCDVLGIQLGSERIFAG